MTRAAGSAQPRQILAQLARIVLAISGHVRRNPNAVIPMDFVGSLEQALAPVVNQVPLSLELAAEIADTSSRTLRCSLAREERAGARSSITSAAAGLASQLGTGP